MNDTETDEWRDASYWAQYTVNERTPEIPPWCRVLMSDQGVAFVKVGPGLPGGEGRWRNSIGGNGKVYTDEQLLRLGGFSPMLEVSSFSRMPIGTRVCNQDLTPRQAAEQLTDEQRALGMTGTKLGTVIGFAPPFVVVHADDGEVWPAELPEDLTVIPR